MKLIASADINWAIGKGNNLLYHAPEDMKFFKETTTGGIVVMGRKTLESLPKSKPLPNRINIVLTTNTDYKCDGAIICHNVDELKEQIANKDNVFVIGGGSIYALLLPLCSEAYITKFDAQTEDADTFITNLDNDEDWDIVSTSETRTHNGLNFTFNTYKRK